MGKRSNLTSILFKGVGSTSLKFSFFVFSWPASCVGFFSGNRTGTLSGSVAGNRGSWEIQTLEFNGSSKRSPGIRRAPVEVGSKNPIIYRVWYISGCSKNGGFVFFGKIPSFSSSKRSTFQESKFGHSQDARVDVKKCWILSSLNMYIRTAGRGKVFFLGTKIRKPIHQV